MTDGRQESNHGTILSVPAASSDLNLNEEVITWNEGQQFKGLNNVELTNRI